MSSDVPVLVVGGGLVGLSAALFLSDLGIPVLLVEQHSGTSTLPRGRGLSLRSTEVFRAAGVEEALRAAPASILRDLPAIMHADTLVGEERFRTVRPAPDTYTDISPTTPVVVDQNAVEPVLREQARRRGAQLRFSTRLDSFEQGDDGVTAVLRDRVTGSTSTVRADYLVAADGHRSAIRGALGVGTSGSGTITRYANIPFEADLSGPLRGRRLALCYLERPVSNTMLTRLDDPRRWVLMVPCGDDGGLPAGEFPRLIREAVGQDVEVRVLDSQLAEHGRAPTWDLASWIADRFRVGRVFLAGDSAHVTPPAGGLGGNAGIQDAHNLAWKLAAVVRGHAAPALLDTYERERRAVATLTADFSAQRQAGRIAGRGDGASGLDPVAVGLGYRYTSAAIVPTPVAGKRNAVSAGVGTDRDRIEAGAATPSRDFTGRPGRRAPHLWLRRAGRPVSTLDLYRGDFVLVAGAKADRWAEAGRRAEVKVPMVVYQLGHDLEDERGDWASAHEVGHAGAVLVRPDGFVCWRAPDDVEAGPAVLAKVFDQILGRRTEPESGRPCDDAGRAQRV
ncbi:FAD-dependent monooxygenase [Micromonospora sp. NPDC047548]|uniref:FAD-dependent monooxygenase n=1 Tax=Micromonospora sp. NPDC047548 TaxID=3155624 RepID=UPI0033F577E1